MTSYAPRDLEQVPLMAEEEWEGDPNSPIPGIEALGINRSTYRYIGQGGIYSTETEPHITTIASEGFVACSGFLMRNRQTGVDTFSHFWPNVTGFGLEDLLSSENEANENDAVVVYGGMSTSTGLESGLANDRWGNIRTRAISVETGSTWWAAVFDRAAGDLVVLRRKPVQSMLKFHLFDS